MGGETCPKMEFFSPSPRTIPSIRYRRISKESFPRNWNLLSPDVHTYVSGDKYFAYVFYGWFPTNFLSLYRNIF